MKTVRWYLNSFDDQSAVWVVRAGKKRNEEHGWDARGYSTTVDEAHSPTTAYEIPAQHALGLINQWKEAHRAIYGKAKSGKR